MLSRRHFLRSSLATAALLGCGGAPARDDGGDPLLPGGDDDAGPGAAGADAAPEQHCDDPLAGGELLATLPLIDSGSPDFGRLYGEGLDARKMLDLATVRPGQLVTPVDSYYLRTGTPDALPDPGSWRLRIGGLVQAPVEVAVADLLPRSKERGTFVMECSGNGTGESFGLMSAGRWRGVPVGQVLDMVRPLPAAARIRFSGYDRHDGPSETSYPGADWIFSRAQLEDAGAFLATHLDGAPLTVEHGAPLRLYVPGWYGCVCIKWLNEIELVADDVAPTFHMLEFARRTMQDGEPELARDWQPAIVDQAAMPVRVEQWKVGGKLRTLVAGILWGGSKPTDRLAVRFGDGDDWKRVEVCPSMTSNASWTPWAIVWDPPAPGTYAITCRIDDPTVRQRRLDAGYYMRKVRIP